MNSPSSLSTPLSAPLNTPHRQPRRRFLLGAGLSVSFLSACSIIPPIPKRPDPKTADALGWITLTAQGRWRLFSPRMEMGQNILAGLRDIAALELGIDPSEIEVRLAHTGEIGRVKGTVGSDSIRELTLPLAQACYTLRLAILERARLQLKGVSLDALSIEKDEVVVQANGNQRIALKALALPALRLEAQNVLPEHLRFFSSTTPKKTSPFPQLDEILKGETLFAADIRLPQMLYALILRSPWPDKGLGNSQLIDWNEAAVRAVPGFHSIARHPLLPGPALLATRISALEPMRIASNAKWETPSPAQPDPVRLIDIDSALKANRFTKTKGAVEEILDLTSASAKQRGINLRIDVPLASHAAIEPRCAVARLDSEGGLELWVGTQDPFYVRDVIQRDTGIALEKIVVHPMRIGGAFGGKTIATVEREASILAVLLKRPIKVQWSRADEFQAGFHRQPSSHRVQAKLDAGGMITDWRHSLSTSHVLFTNAILPPWLQALTNFVGDDGAARGQQPLYGFARQRLDLKLTRLPVFTGPWRGLGAGPNVLAIEMAMDAAARVAGVNPLEFRLKHLGGAPAGHASINQAGGDPKRLRQCLLSVDQLAKAKPLTDVEQRPYLAKLDPSLKLTRARGLAGGAYKGTSYAAAIAELVIGVDAKGQLKFIQTLKLWCSHDCGLLVNESAVQAQVQGNLVWSIGMVLKERLSAARGTPEQLNFTEYSIPRMSDIPNMEITLLNSTAPPSGAGETAIVAGGGAIANALTRAFIDAGLDMPTSFPIAL
jgi:isoquinoline 1-oxidoreductase subunit beta